jgi:hypothetical protein
MGKVKRYKEQIVNLLRQISDFFKFNYNTSEDFSTLVARCPHGLLLGGSLGACVLWP